MVRAIDGMDEATIKRVIALLDKRVDDLEREMRIPSNYPYRHHIKRELDEVKARREGLKSKVRVSGEPQLEADEVAPRRLPMDLQPIGAHPRLETPPGFGG